ARNRMGMLAGLSAAIADAQTNISHVTIENSDSETQVIVFVLEVRDRDQLADVMRLVRRMADVLHVVRTIATHGRKREATLP
ncbi:MAG TPA: ACT domain-containing protein, partial [Steroidobacteraceae bacterium]|nr:ACT domain-containing protein [Steroidobacteraceae bacterium]